MAVFALRWGETHPVDIQYLIYQREILHCIMMPWMGAPALLRGSSKQVAKMTVHFLAFLTLGLASGAGMVVAQAGCSTPAAGPHSRNRSSRTRNRPDVMSGSGVVSVGVSPG